MTSSGAPAASPVLAAVRDAVGGIAARRSADARPLRVAVALSGGRDSVALLDALATLAPELGIALSAVHVHHGLSPNADAWAAFCGDECARQRIAFAVRRVHVDAACGESPEAAARTARYAALAQEDADVIALAHHADDQAETLLLQLLRGAGPHGLAAMAVHRTRAGVPSLLRPFLALPRATIEAYVAARGLAFVDDESNANTGLRRNLVRRDIAPRLAAAFPGYPATLVRAAAHQAEAARLADDLARIDAAQAVATDAALGPTLARDALATLARAAPHRARNLLRWFLRERGLAAPSAARLAAMLDQLVRAASDARVRIVHAGAEIGVHRGRIAIHAPAVAPFAVAWHGEPSLELPHGTLGFASCKGAGIARSALESAAVTVRSRAGGERIQVAPDRPRRALKGLLQDAGVPAWQRASLPLVFCGDALAAVPGVGVDTRFQAPAGAPGCGVCWRPRDAVGARSGP